MFAYLEHSAVMPFRGSSLDLESQEAIARRLKAIRLASDATQAEMAEAIGLASTGQGWGNYETGERRISIDQAISLVKKFGVSLDWIYLGRLTYLPVDLADQIRLAERRIAEDQRKSSRRA